MAQTLTAKDKFYGPLKRVAAQYVPLLMARMTVLQDRGNRALEFLEADEEEEKEPDLEGLSAADLKIVNTRVNALDPEKISFKVDATGGPSGGLVFSIGLIELLTEVDLIQDRHIAGTGTIDSRGVVGPIGGINEKILSAKKVGATVFFAPVGNAEEISNVPEGIKVITVATVAQAVSYLERTRK